MALKPWYTIVTPREDLRSGKPLDAAEFAVHLDKVRDGSAPSVYQNPDEFFERTYLTRKLAELGVEVVRRLSGEINDASAVFNLTTQFGGGKTHALTMLYHLAEHGEQAHQWRGVSKIVDQAKIQYVPQAATAVFVGQQFDLLTGRGGDDGTPKRRTPWGEIAWQLGGEQSFAHVRQHDEQGIAPGGDVVQRMIPDDRPSLILMDEVMNYISRSRRSGLEGEFYNFMQNLTEEVRNRRGVVLVVSLQASELEMSPEDERDFQTFRKMLNRVGKAVLISSEHESAEIIRRRLFEWKGLDREAEKTIKAFSQWVSENNQQLSEPFSREQAWDAFASTYPFHPTVLSVFERKWQALPRFQRTRGVLQLLARWVSRAYHEGYQGAHRDPLIDLGTAPLDDPDFRAAVFEQLGEERLEAAVTTDIAGKADSHSLILDREAQDTIRQARLHRKVASTIFFESNGGQMHTDASVPEVRLAVGYPDLDIGNIETVLETLSQYCYFLSIERNRYRFSMRENLIKKHADYRALVSEQRINERIEQEIQKAFQMPTVLNNLPRELRDGAKLSIVLLPETSSAITQSPQLTFVVLGPAHTISDKRTATLVEQMTFEYGSSTRQFKNSLIWCVADDNNSLRDNAKRTLAWEDIQDEMHDAPRIDDALDEMQRRQLHQHLEKSRAEMRESVWRTYRHIRLMDKGGSLQHIDMGMLHSSQAPTILNHVLLHLLQQDYVTDTVGVNFLLRNWPPALQEWSTKSIRDAFFASTRFPRLLKPDNVRSTIVRGVSEGYFAYVSRLQDGKYNQFVFNRDIDPIDVEISDDVAIIRRETAEAYGHAKNQQPIPDINDNSFVATGDSLQDVFEVETTHQTPTPSSSDGISGAQIRRLRWSGVIPAQKWTIFYNKVLSRFAVGHQLRLRVEFDVRTDNGLSSQKLEETRLSLRELNLDDNVDTRD